MIRIFQFVRQLPQAFRNTFFPNQNEVHENLSTLNPSPSSSQRADPPATKQSLQLMRLPQALRDKDFPDQKEVHERLLTLVFSLSSPQVTSLPAMSGPFQFMELGEKLRTKVYSVCLMVEGHVTPYREFYVDDRQRDYKGDKLASFLPLLQVSKLVREEAEKVFWGKNTFRITPCALQFTDRDILDRRFKVGVYLYSNYFEFLLTFYQAPLL